MQSSFGDGFVLAASIGDMAAAMFQEKASSLVKGEGKALAFSFGVPSVIAGLGVAYGVFHAGLGPSRGFSHP